MSFSSRLWLQRFSSGPPSTRPCLISLRQTGFALRTVALPSRAGRPSGGRTWISPPPATPQWPWAIISSPPRRAARSRWSTRSVTSSTVRGKCGSTCTTLRCRMTLASPRRKSSLCKMRGLAPSRTSRRFTRTKAILSRRRLMQPGSSTRTVKATCSSSRLRPASIRSVPQPRRRCPILLVKARSRTATRRMAASRSTVARVGRIACTATT